MSKVSSKGEFSCKAEPDALMIINYINVFLNITALVIGLKPISMINHPLNRMP